MIKTHRTHGHQLNDNWEILDKRGGGKGQVFVENIMSNVFTYKKELLNTIFFLNF